MNRLKTTIIVISLILALISLILAAGCSTKTKLRYEKNPYTLLYNGECDVFYDKYKENDLGIVCRSNDKLFVFDDHGRKTVLSYKELGDK